MQPLQIPVAVLAIALPLTPVVHDLRTRQRLHPATAWGVADYFLVVAAPAMRRIGHGRRTGGDWGAAIVAH